MSEFSRILVVRLSALGDVLLATPAVRAPRHRFPEAEIDWLVEDAYLPLVSGNPHARALAYEKRGKHRGVGGWLRLRRELAARRYDLVVDLQSKPKTALLRGVAGESVALRKRSPLRAVLALVGHDPPYTRSHAVDLFLRALEPLDVPVDGRDLELVVTPEMQREAAQTLGGGAGELVGIAPGARWETKRWPTERFGELASELARRGLTPLLIGGPLDTETIAEVRAALPDGAPVRDTVGLSVGGLAAAIARCRLVVAGDSGPVHIASALQVPVVAIFGPTSPDRWRPLTPHAQVVRLPLSCSPCSNHGTNSCAQEHHDCMRKLTVEPVLAASLRVLER